jgi:hypothetical protein
MGNTDLYITMICRAYNPFHPTPLNWLLSYEGLSTEQRELVILISGMCSVNDLDGTSREAKCSLEVATRFGFGVITIQVFVNKKT